MDRTFLLLVLGSMAVLAASAETEVKAMKFDEILHTEQKKDPAFFEREYGSSYNTFRIVG